MIIEIIGISAAASMIVMLLGAVLAGSAEKPGVLLFMAVFGAAVGYIYGMIWVFLTGGLMYNAIGLFGVIMISLVCGWFALTRFTDVIEMASRIKAGKLTKYIGVCILAVLAVLIMIGSVPPVYGNSVNTTSFSTTSKSIIRNNPLLIDMDKVDTNMFTLSSNPTSFIDIDSITSGVSFPYLTETPNEGDYLEFEVTFTVGTSGGSWDQPWIRILVVNDDNNNGVADSTDQIWGSSTLKVATTSNNWRSCCAWENNAPYMQLSVIGLSDGSVLPMPIFHASSISTWQDDTNDVFSNTPEKYKPTHDQFSLELSGNSLSVKESIETFAKVNKGQTTTIRGKIYCFEGSSGSKVLWIGAYDYRYQNNPFGTDQNALFVHNHPFSIGGSGGSCTNGDEKCVGDDLYECINGEWVLKELSSSQCSGSAPVIDTSVQTWVVGGVLGISALGAFIISKKYI